MTSPITTRTHLTAQHRPCRLLARFDGKVLVVHDGWSPRTGTVIVLPDSEELAWEFSH